MVTKTSPTRLLEVLGVAILTTWVGGCDEDKVTAEDCKRAPSEEQCVSCCRQVGRNDATWVDDDCVCSSN